MPAIWNIVSRFPVDCEDIVMNFLDIPGIDCVPSYSTAEFDVEAAKLIEKQLFVPWITNNLNPRTISLMYKILCLLMEQGVPVSGVPKDRRSEVIRSFKDIASDSLCYNQFHLQFVKMYYIQ